MNQKSIAALSLITIALVALNAPTVKKQFMSFVQTQSQDGFTLVNKTVYDTKLIGIIQYQNSTSQFYDENQFSPYIKQLKLKIETDMPDQISIRITDHNNARYEIPKYSKYFGYTKNTNTSNAQKEYSVDYGIENNQLYIDITRASTNEVIFSTRGRTFVYSDRYLQIGINLPSQYLYGLGERRRLQFLFTPGTYTIFPLNAFGEIITPQNKQSYGGQETYGYHPVYLIKEQSGNWHVVYFKTSTSMDFIVGNGTNTLDFKVVGGIFDFQIFLGDQFPNTAIKKYHNYINNYALMPFWAMGFHQSRWGYNSTKTLLHVADMYQALDVPLDTMWSDIDYMYQYITYTVNAAAFKQSDIDQLKSQGLKWVCIIDPETWINSSFPAYNQGLEQNVYIISGFTNERIINCIWCPGEATWVDYNHPNSSSYYQTQILSLYNQLEFDGLWLDMNEFATFWNAELTATQSCTGGMFLQDNEQQPAKKPVLKTYNEELYEYAKTQKRQLTAANPFQNSSQLPYQVGNMPLESQTLSINAKHYSGPDARFITAPVDIYEIDFHALNAFTQAATVHEAQMNLFKKPQPFILTRETFPGSGQFAAHWTGDNVSGWQFLQASIPSIFNFQIFGIPFVGADICGFMGDAWQELCARWFQLGAFYPFSRNHNNYGQVDQEAFAWGNTSVVLYAAKNSLNLRYSLLKHYYTQFVRNQGAGSVFQPAWFAYPQDSSLMNLEVPNSVESQLCPLCNYNFLIGNDLMFAPVVTNGTNQTQILVPLNSTWFNLTGNEVYSAQGLTSQDPIIKRIFTIDNYQFQAPPALIRAGSIVCQQNAETYSNTNNLNNTFNLVIGLDQQENNQSTFYSYAQGQILGISDYLNQETVINKCYTENSDCLINIQANVTSNLYFQKEGQYFVQSVSNTLNVIFNKNSENTYFETSSIFIDQIIIKSEFGFQQIEETFSLQQTIELGKTYSFSYSFNN